MNILLIIVLVLLICKIRDGYKRGMVKEIISFVSLIILCVVLALLANGVSNYFDKKYINVFINLLEYIEKSSEAQGMKNLSFTLLSIISINESLFL